MSDAVKKEIYNAIAAIQAGVGELPRNGHMKFGQTDYHFVTSDDVLSKVNELYIKHGVVNVTKIAVRDISRPVAWDAAGNANRFKNYVYVELMLELIATKDGTSVTYTATGEAAADDDKAIRKATTQAQKIIDLLAFKIVTGEPDYGELSTGEAKAEKAPARQVATASKARATTTKATAPAASEVTLQKLREEAMQVASIEKIGTLGDKLFLKTNKDWREDPQALQELISALKEDKDSE